MRDALLTEIVRAALEQMRDAGVRSFAVGDLQALDTQLAKVEPREIERVLFRLWERGGGVHAEEVGEDGRRLWVIAL